MEAVTFGGLIVVVGAIYLMIEETGLLSRKKIKIIKFERPSCSNLNVNVAYRRSK